MSPRFISCSWRRTRADSLRLCPHCSYPTLPVSFLVTELAFEHASEAVSFLTAHNADRFVAPAAGAPRFPSYADKIWDCKASAPALVEAVSRNVKVDIKGQL